MIDQLSDIRRDKLTEHGKRIELNERLSLKIKADSWNYTTMSLYYLKRRKNIGSKNPEALKD